MPTSQSPDTYQSLCAQYYDLDKPTAPAADVAFYLNYAKAAQGLILEPMYGTGSFLIPCMQAGITLEGFDASPWMLEICAQKCAAQGLKPKIWQGFLQDLNKPERYSLIFIPSGSFGLITDLEQTKRCLKKIHEHLSQDGLFVFETETPLSAAPPYHSRTKSVTRADGKKISLSLLTMPLEDQVESTTCRYDLLEGNTVVQSENELFKVRLYDPATMCALLKEAGFSTIKPLKAFDRTKSPDTEDDLVVYECSK